MSLTINAPAFAVEPLSPVLGAAVTGLDPRPNRCPPHRANPNFGAARFPRVLHRTSQPGTAPA